MVQHLRVKAMRSTVSLMDGHASTNALLPIIKVLMHGGGFGGYNHERHLRLLYQ